METRPILKIEPSLHMKFLFYVGLIFLIGQWILIALYYTKLPEVTATHFGADGKPDGYGSKATFLFIPLFSSLIFLLFTYLKNRPHVLNYAVKITDKNAEFQYDLAVKLLIMMRAALAIIFFALLYKSMMVGLGHRESIGGSMLFIVVILIILPVVTTIYKSITHEKD